MEELYKNGPVVLNFEPTFDFMFYVGGVFHSTTPEWIINGLAKPEWVINILNLGKSGSFCSLLWLG